MAHFINAILREKWEWYSLDRPWLAKGERMWWFEVGNEFGRVILFGPGPTLEVARSRLESSIRLLSPQEIRMLEFDRGELVTVGPSCPVHELVCTPKGEICWRRVRLWQCGAPRCDYHVWTFSPRGYRDRAPYSMAGAGTPFDICEQGKW